MSDGLSKVSNGGRGQVTEAGGAAPAAAAAAEVVADEDGVVVDDVLVVGVDGVGLDA